jgi:diguanylate cyclase (GGDEF)-like protein/PAS domain S-box-containing protein
VSDPGDAGAERADRAATPIDEADGFERAVIDHLYDGVYYVDRARRIRYWNQGAERLTGYEATAVVGQFCYQNLLNHVDAAGKQLCRSGCPLAATMGDGEPREAEIFLRHREGHRVPVRVRTTPVRDREGTIIGAVEIFDDNTELSAARREVRELRDVVMRDPLTNLPNRRHFEMSMATRIAELAGYGRRFGLLIADIDRFKRVNDRHGHAAGDIALRTVARTLLESSRAGDDIARFGGEEFVLTITGVDEAALREIAERFRALVEQSRVLAGERDLRITISMGGTIAEVGDTAEAIFGRADAALYRAKDDGRNRVVLDVDPEAATA